MLLLKLQLSLAQPLIRRSSECLIHPKSKVDFLI